jgi:hypothetical protein
VWYLLILPLLVLLPFMGSYLLPPLTSYSDLLISHLPNAIFLRQALWQYHQIPLWSPTILSGYPFAANPLSGMWYPPGWLGVLIPDPWGINLAIFLHLVWGGTGLYLFLKREGLSPLSAILGGILFTALPKTIAHFGLGHITLVYAVSWTPWLFYFQGISTENHAVRRFPIYPGIILGMIALADVRWVIPAGLAWAMFALYQDLRSAAGADGTPKQLTEIISRSILQIGLALLISAPMLIPLWQYTNLSTRAAMDPGQALAYSLPPVQLLGLIFPNGHGSAEWTSYLGGVTLALLLVSILDRKHWKRYLFWWAVGALSLVFALGENVPIVRNFFFLPGIRLIRAPSRFLFLTGLSGAVLAATALDALRDGVKTNLALRRPGSILTIAGCGFFILLLASGLFTISHMNAWEALWSGCMLASASALIVFYLKNRLSWNRLAMILVALLIVDLNVVNRQVVRPVQVPPAQTGQEALLAQLNTDHSLFRVYSPSYSIPQDQAARGGLQLADGIDPLQLAGYWQAMQIASGVPSGGYSVTMPSFASAAPETDNAAYLPNPARLGLFNVKYVVSAFDLPVDGLTEIGRYGETRLYLNRLSRSRAWVQTGGPAVEMPSQDVEGISWSPEQIIVQASGPGELVLSELDYPGWTVDMDGAPGKVDRVDGVLRGVALAAGSHQVKFEFKPGVVTLGLAAAGLGWAIVLVGVFWSVRKRKA